MLGRLVKRRKLSRRAPSPEQAYLALREGRCLYSAPGRSCSPKLKSVGLRDDDDADCVLACSGHYGALRRLPAADLEKLRRALREAFGERRTAV